MNIFGAWDTDDVAYLAGLVVKYNAELNKLRAINAAADKEIDRLRAELAKRDENEQVLDS